MNQYLQHGKIAFQRIQASPRLFFLSLLLKIVFVILFALLFSYFFQKILFYLTGAVQIMQSDALQITSLSSDAISPQALAGLQQMNALFSQILAESFLFSFFSFLLLVIFGQIDFFVLFQFKRSAVSFLQLLKNYSLLSFIYWMLLLLLIFSSFFLHVQNTSAPISFFSTNTLLILVSILFVLLTYLFLCCCFVLPEKTFSLFFKRLWFLLRKGFFAFLLFLVLTLLLVFIHFFLHASVGIGILLFLLFIVCFLFYEVYLLVLSEKSLSYT